MTGVGVARSVSQTLKPLPAITSAQAAAKSSLAKRRSKPTTTASPDLPADNR